MHHTSEFEEYTIDGMNTFINTDLLPGWLGHVKVRPWRVAPSAIVIGEGVVGRTEVCGSDGDRNTGLAKQRVRTLAIACDLVALPARRHH